MTGAGVSGVRFVGGMNVPGALGRVNASMPLAELTVRDGELALRPRWFGAWFFTRFAVPVSEIEQAFPLRGRVLTPGVGLSLTDGEEAYFWTFDGDRVLAALAGVGVPMGPEPRRASHRWRLWRRRGTAATRTAQMTRPLVLLFPLMALVSIVMMIALLASNSNGWLDALIGTAWLVALVVNSRVWWHSRRRSA
jgi:hypothetical protein